MKVEKLEEIKATLLNDVQLLREQLDEVRICTVYNVLYLKIF